MMRRTRGEKDKNRTRGQRGERIRGQ